MKTKIISLLYFFAGFQYIIGLISFLPGLITKALLIPILMIILVINLSPGKERLHWLMLAGLFFSWAGDIVLELAHRNGDLFVLGLLFFLLAHVMYFTVFVLTPGKNIVLSSHFYLLIPVVLTGAALVFYLYNDLGAMRIPVILYAIVILTMLTGAINRMMKVPDSSYRIVLAGAILFVISDSAIAINKFSHPFAASGIVVMTTYLVAQYLIITGYIKQFRERTE
jgi:uncharacterized membrane protein YhhN